MTNIAGSRAQPAHVPSHRAPGPASQPTAQDVRAMGEAMTRARQQMAGGKTGNAQAKGQPMLAGKVGNTRETAKGEARGEVREAGREGTGNRSDLLADPVHRDREDGDRGGNQGGGQGLAQQAVPLPVTAPAMPSPTVDPSGFAQMLADLWTRENGKGAKEVSVRFGRDAWPTTGARLARNAAGTLDISLLVDDGGRVDTRALDDLEGRLTGAGIGVGALGIEQG